MRWRGKYSLMVAILSGSWISYLRKNVKKVKYGLLLLKCLDKIPTKFVKYVRDDIYELRTEYNGNVFRVFFIFDNGNIVVLFNGFQKKTRKTPENEIERAIKIKKDYYADK